MRRGRMFRSGRTRPADGQSNNPETLSRIQSLADYTIDTLESSFRKRHVFGFLDRAAGGAINKDRIHCITGLGIDEQHARAFGCKVLVTPGEQRHDDGTEIASPRGQDIFIARRPFAVAAALQKSRLDESIEPSRQYVGSDAETPLELMEPRH